MNTTARANVTTSENTHADCATLTPLDRCDACWKRTPDSVVPALLVLARENGVERFPADAFSQLHRVAADFMKAVGLPMDA